MTGFVALASVFDYDRGWNWETLEYVDFWTPAGMVRHLLFNGFHPVIPWLAFLIVGLIVGRLDLRDRAIRNRVLAAGALATVVAESGSKVLIRTLSQGSAEAELEEIAALFGTGVIPPMPLYMVAGAGTACAVIAVAVGVGQRFPNAVWLRPLVSTGQLALTLYVAHVVLGMGAIASFGRLDGRTLPFVVTTTAVFCALGVVFAHLWRHRFPRGPLETIMRAVT